MGKAETSGCMKYLRVIILTYWASQFLQFVPLYIFSFPLAVMGGVIKNHGHVEAESDVLLPSIGFGRVSY